MADLCNVVGATIPADGLANYDADSNGKSNPMMPGEIYGIKFEAPYVENAQHITLSFYCDRAPTWGDFYAKDGKGVLAYNTGFTSDDVDPTCPASNGSLNGHLLVPDTVPEPGLLTLLGIGGVGLLRRKRRSVHR